MFDLPLIIVNIFLVLLIFNIRSKWEEMKLVDKNRIYRDYLHEYYGECPKLMEPWLCRKIFTNYLNSPTSLVLFNLLVCYFNYFFFLLILINIIKRTSHFCTIIQEKVMKKTIDIHSILMIY